MWELDVKEEIEVNEITITPFLFGCPPEALTDVSFFVNKIDLEEVEMDHCKGWNLDERIAYSHPGYLIKSAKIALTQKINNSHFYILDESTSNLDFSTENVIRHL